MASARLARRRRNAILTAFALAAVLILVIIMIIVGISNSNKKKNDTAKATATPSNNLVLPTIAPVQTDILPTDTPDDVIATPTPTPTASPDDGSRTMYVTGDDVNVRKEASTSADVVTKLAKGTSVAAYETADKFIRIKLSDGTVGYMSKDFLSETRPSVTTSTATAAATPDTSKSSTKYITANDVNVRKEASTGSDKVTRLNKGTKVTAYSTVTAGSTKWTYIEYAKNKFGYVATQYLADQAPANTPTPTPTSNTSSATPTPTPAHATSEADFLPEDVASKVKVGQSRLNQTKVKMAQTLTPPAGYSVIYEVEKTNGSYYYITLKDSPSASYIIYDNYEDIGK